MPSLTHHGRRSDTSFPSKTLHAAQDPSQRWSLDRVLASPWVRGGGAPTIDAPGPDARAPTNDAVPEPGAPRDLGRPELELLLSQGAQVCRLGAGHGVALARPGQAPWLLVVLEGEVGIACTWSLGRQAPGGSLTRAAASAGDLRPSAPVPEGSPVRGDSPDGGAELGPRGLRRLYSPMASGWSTLASSASPAPSPVTRLWSASPRPGGGGEKGGPAGGSPDGTRAQPPGRASPGPRRRMWGAAVPRTNHLTSPAEGEEASQGSPAGSPGLAAPGHGPALGTARGGRPDWRRSSPVPQLPLPGGTEFAGEREECAGERKECAGEREECAGEREEYADAVVATASDATAVVGSEPRGGAGSSMDGSQQRPGVPTLPDPLARGWPGTSQSAVLGDSTCGESGSRAESVYSTPPRSSAGVSVPGPPPMQGQPPGQQDLAVLWQGRELARGALAALSGLDAGRAGLWEPGKRSVLLAVRRPGQVAGCCALLESEESARPGGLRMDGTAGVRGVGPGRTGAVEPAESRPHSPNSPRPGPAGHESVAPTPGMLVSLSARARAHGAVVARVRLDDAQQALATYPEVGTGRSMGREGKASWPRSHAQTCRP